MTGGKPSSQICLSGRSSVVQEVLGQNCQNLLQRQREAAAVATCTMTFSTKSCEFAQVYIT